MRFSTILLDDALNLTVSKYPVDKISLSNALQMRELSWSDNNNLSPLFIFFFSSVLNK